MALSSIDQQKLLNAGFTLIRKEDKSQLTRQAATATESAAIVRKPSGFIIKAKQGERHEWFTFEKEFASAAARDRRMIELLAKPTYLEV